MKRFYKVAATGEVAGGYEVQLDGRPVRSPAKAPLLFKSKALAEAVAAEWEAQGETIEPGSMPLMQLASTAVDLINVGRKQIVDGVAAYAETDLLCYRAEYPQSLIHRQSRDWQPLLDWVTQRYDAHLHVATGLMPKPQPPEALLALRRAVKATDDWTLSALQTVTGACGSLVVALALLEGHIDAERAFEVSQLDETHQIEQWGEDPETAKRRVGLRADITACRRFVDLLRA